MFNLRYWLFSLYPSNFLYPPIVWLLVPVCLYGTAILVGLLGGRQIPLVTVLSNEDLIPAYKFSEERAMPHLKAISFVPNPGQENVGTSLVRVAGTASYFKARDYILSQVKKVYGVSVNCYVIDN